MSDEDSKLLAKKMVSDPETSTAQPSGLRTLFFTEMWERMSYYGMRALLVLFMVDAVEKGGLGFNDENATAIYGLYSAAVYLVALPGGWIGDRLLGAQRSIWFGGIIMSRFMLKSKAKADAGIVDDGAGDEAA